MTLLSERAAVSVRRVPRTPKSSNSVALRKYQPTPDPSGSPSSRVFTHVILVVYRKPQADMTFKPSGSIADGTHKYRCALSATMDATGISQMSDNDIVL